MGLANKVEGLRALLFFDNRWHLAVQRILFPNDPCSVYRIGGLRILVDHSAGDANGTREVFTTPMYRRTLAAMDRDEITTVLDVGAHTGGFALLTATEVPGLERVLCVEMNPNTFHRLAYNLNENLPDRARAVHAAVCGTRDALTVPLGRGGTGDSMTGSIDSTDVRPYVIPALTLDDVIAEAAGVSTVDLCKIDIEGAEYEIVDSGSFRQLRRCRYVIIEIHRRAGRSADEILEVFAELDFAPLLPPEGDVHSFYNRSLVD